METRLTNLPATLEDIRRDRQWQIAKSNSFIQKSRFDMNLMQQKILLHIISKVKPTDEEFQNSYKFNYYDFCRLCGISSSRGGKNFTEFKQSLLDLRMRASEVRYIDVRGHEVVTAIGWITYYSFDTKTGEVEVQLDRNLAPFLLELKGLYTTYPLLFILPMKSKYSVRLYELIKSYSNRGCFEIEIQELRKLLQNKYIYDREKEKIRKLEEKDIKYEYTDFYDFDRFVLKKATEEINSYTDISVEYKVNRISRKPVSITFFIFEKDKNEIDKRINEINDLLDKNTKNKKDGNSAKKNKNERILPVDESELITKKLEYIDGSSKPILKKALYRRLGEKFSNGYSDYKKQILEEIIDVYCLLGNRHQKNDKRIDGGNVYYIDNINKVIEGNQFRELVDFQVIKYSSEKMEERYEKVLLKKRYLQTCVENDLICRDEFIEKMKKTAYLYDEVIRYNPQEDLLLKNMTNIPVFTVSDDEKE